MTRLAPLFPLVVLVACQGEVGIGAVDTDVDTEPDFSRFEGASLRIVEPASGTFLAWQEPHTFRVELRDAQGELLDEELDVAWDSSSDAAWTPTGVELVDDSIDVGLHDLTAEVVLPNGDRLAHTVGGVLIQAEEAGTYVGTLSGGTTVQNIPVSCAGGAVLVVDPYGESVQGSADCLIRLDQFELPLEFAIDAVHEDGVVTGDAIARLLAIDLEFPTEGGIEGETLELSFEGQVLTNTFSGDIRTERISRDAGL